MIAALYARKSTTDQDSRTVGERGELTTLGTKAASWLYRSISAPQGGGSQ